MHFTIQTAGNKRYKDVETDLSIYRIRSATSNYRGEATGNLRCGIIYSDREMSSFGCALLLVTGRYSCFRLRPITAGKFRSIIRMNLEVTFVVNKKIVRVTVISDSALH